MATNSARTYLPAAACTLAVLVSSSAQPAWSADTDARAASLEDVVVTATKRAERLQDTAVAISDLGSDRLEELGIKNFADYVGMVPNVNLMGGAAPGLGTVVIRGLANGNAQTNATTATYIGETPFTANATVSLSSLINPDPDLVDVDRVEVLKGPQGTLYGASSLGGLIRIIPKEPDPKKFSGAIRVAGDGIDGGGVGGGISGSVNVPIADNVAALVSAFVKNDPGFTKNLATGHDHLGSTKSEGGTAAIKFQFSDNWDAKLSGLYQYSHTDGLQYQYDVAGSGTPVYGDRTYSSGTDGKATSTYWSIEGTSHYRISAGTFTITASKSHYDVDIIRDDSDSYGALELALLPPGILPAGLSVVTDQDPISDKTSVELRFASNRLGRVEFVPGFFYTEENTQYPVAIQNQDPPGVPLNLPGPAAALDNLAKLNTLNLYREYSGFADLTYYITDKFDLTAGGRYSHNEQVVQAISPPGGLINLGNYSLDFSDHSALFLASARWRPTEELSVYARAASGYRPGGPQPTGITPPGIPQTFKPDTVVTYEGGVKGVSSDRRLTFDVAVYHSDWKDIQLNTVVGGILFIGNGGAASVNGLEAQFDWNDPSGVRVGANAGFNDAKLNSIDTATSLAIGANKGDRLPGSSRWTASGYLEYHRSLTASMTGSVGMTVRYQGDKVSSFPNAALDTTYLIPSYVTADVRAGVDWSRYSLAFHVFNATDQNGISGYEVPGVAPGLGTVARAYLIRPRSFELSLAAKF
jgi:iron complex outermembrane receptor protein